MCYQNNILKELDYMLQMSNVIYVEKDVVLLF